MAARVSKPTGVSGARPVVKWVGGKARLVERLLDLMPAGGIGTYAEPFCGGGAMFFALASLPKRPFKRAILSDKNEDLVALYHAIQQDLDALIDRVGAYEDKHLALDHEGRSAHYYRVRKAKADKLSIVERGARLLFLNRTCFNGLWRVNSSGQFNVPFGRYANPKILNEEVLRAAAEALDGVEVNVSDFAETTSKLRKGDFVYFDPPYVPVSKTSNFTAYATDRFGTEEQARLVAELARLRRRGVRAMLSNAFLPETEALYAEFRTVQVTMDRLLNSDPSKRGGVSEIVVMNYSSSAGAS